MLCKSQVEGLQELQDLMNCIILSEHVYKVSGEGWEWRRLEKEAGLEQEAWLSRDRGLEDNTVAEREGQGLKYACRDH